MLHSQRYAKNPRRCIDVGEYLRVTIFIFHSRQQKGERVSWNCVHFAFVLFDFCFLNSAVFGLHREKSTMYKWPDYYRFTLMWN